LVGGHNSGRANLPGVKYLNSYRSGTKHDCFALMDPNPADFKIGPGVQPFVRRLLNVTGLNRYLHLSTPETPLVTHVDACPRHHARTEESGLIQAPE